MCISIIVGQRHRGQFCKHRNSDIHHLSISLPDWVFFAGPGLVPAAAHLFIPVSDWPNAGQPGIDSLDLTLSILSPFYKCFTWRCGEGGERWTYAHFVQADWWWRRKPPYKILAKELATRGLSDTYSAKFKDCGNEEYIFGHCSSP
jgi:hypothetical protein